MDGWNLRELAERNRLKVLLTFPVILTTLSLEIMYMEMVRTTPDVGKSNSARNKAVPNSCHHIFSNRRSRPDKITPVPERPPWVDLRNLSSSSSSNSTSDQRVFYLTTGNGGRLGNQMFGYASLFGIAWNTSRIPLWNNDGSGLRSIFKNLRIDPDHNGPYRKDKFITISEKGPTVIAEIDNLPPANIHLDGYLQQPFRYFAHVNNQVRYDFTFAPDVIAKAQEMLNVFNATSLRDEGYVRVMIHVRRSDLGGFTDTVLKLQPDYMNRSMQYFRNCLPKVHFIVLSDEIQWCRQNIALYSDHVDFIEGDRPPAVDLAIASLCDHAIITVGTFGWWAAWFANGATIEPTLENRVVIRPPFNRRKITV